MSGIADVTYTVAQAADRAGISASTWRSYVARGQAPQPAERIGRTPLWGREEVDAWVTARPGAGTRTDLHHDRWIADRADGTPAGVRWFSSTGHADEDAATLTGRTGAQTQHLPEQGDGRAWAVYASDPTDPTGWRHGDRLGTIHYAPR